MAWWGAIAGGLVGGMFFGPLGTLLGVVAGSWATRKKHHGGFTALPKDMADVATQQERRQLAFFAATFSVMGYIAKLDGRVTRAEIQHAEAVMSHMSLTKEQRQAAVELFNQGKLEDFDLQGVLDQFYVECRKFKNLLRVFIALQIQAALADGEIDANEQDALRNIAAYLKFGDREFDEMFHAERATASGHDAHSVAEAYQILEIDEDCDDAEVKRAYRRMMSRYHPDKLVSKGLPDEMMDMATEKTKEIRAAYEIIKESRT